MDSSCRCCVALFANPHQNLADTGCILLALLIGLGAVSADYGLVRNKGGPNQGGPKTRCTRCAAKFCQGGTMTSKSLYNFKCPKTGIWFSRPLATETDIHVQDSCQRAAQCYSSLDGIASSQGNDVGSAVQLKGDGSNCENECTLNDNCRSFSKCACTGKPWCGKCYLKDKNIHANEVLTDYNGCVTVYKTPCPEVCHAQVSHGDCWSDNAQRRSLGSLTPQQCAQATAGNPLCSSFFEVDAGNNNRCDCWGKNGDGCIGPSGTVSTSTLYQVVQCGDLTPWTSQSDYHVPNRIEILGGTAFVVLVDVMAGTWTRCHIRGCFFLKDMTQEHACPKDMPRSDMYDLMMGLSFVILVFSYCLGCRGGRFWLAVMNMMNHCSFSIGLGMAMTFEEGPGLQATILTFALSYPLWVVPIKAISGYAVCFRILVPFWGMVWLVGGVQSAYDPYIIPIIGHHPFISGLQSFLFANTQDVVKRWIWQHVLYRAPQLDNCISRFILYSPAKEAADYTIQNALRDSFYNAVPNIGETTSARAKIPLEEALVVKPVD